GRDPYEVIKDIIRVTGGDANELLKHGEKGVFDLRAMAGISVLATEYQRTGGFGTFDRFKNVAASDADIEAAFALRRGTGASKLKAAGIALQKFVDQNFGGIAEFGAAHAFGIQAGIRGAGLLGTGLSYLGKGGGLVGGVGGALSNVTAQRVFVVGGRLDS